MSGPSHALRFDIDRGQERGDLSFLGGRPRLPPGAATPRCTICGRTLCFYFQVAFPEDHCWGGHSLATFACIGCADPSASIPEIHGPGPAGEGPPPAFLLAYQRNFAFSVFETRLGVPSVTPGPIAFQPIVVAPRAPVGRESRLGGVPRWIQGDETPGPSGEARMEFLLQLEQGLRFRIGPDALPQTDLDLDGRAAPARRRFYRLFNSNEIYFFGVELQGSRRVYVVTQRA